jgi:hypothetical protein
LDYLMYHELLHKHHRFHHKNGRSSFHFRDFRNDESLYPNQKDIDLEIEHFLRSKVRIARSKKSSLWNLFRIKF